MKRKDFKHITVGFESDKYEWYLLPTIKYSWYNQEFRNQTIYIHFLKWFMWIDIKTGVKCDRK